MEGFSEPRCDRAAARGGPRKRWRDIIKKRISENGEEYTEKNASVYNQRKFILTTEEKVMTIGFIGIGNMGGAMLGGAIRSGHFKPEDIYASDISRDALQKIKDEYKINTAKDNKEAAGCDMLILAVKPQFLYGVIDDIKDSVSSETLIVSIAAGQSIEKIENAFGKKIRLVRVMPNTPALVGEAMSAISGNENVLPEQMNTVKEFFECFGKAEIVPEKLMDAVTGVSGSSPAYIFMLIEAMADAAVNAGMMRSQAYIFAAQAVLGSAKMVLETGLHPGILKDMVCSPAGTTIEAVKTLEDKGFRSAVMDAIDVCVKKSQSM